jgi:prepilin-type N-terminal cleavage/methylation domain-containing protein
MLNNQKGVTLLELLISITLLAILLIPMSNLFLLSFQTTGATKVQLNDRTIAIDILEALKENVRSNNPSFTYAEKSFDVCSGDCDDVSLDINGKDYIVEYSIDNNFKAKLIAEGFDFPTSNSNTLHKIDLILKPTYKPQGSEDIEYSVIVARKNS